VAALLVLAVLVVAGAAWGLWTLERRLDAERVALDRSAAVTGRLRAALDELQRSTRATAAAHDRLGAAPRGDDGPSGVPG
jgi:hypothetical protein